jgi:CO/xanthine dehydrogenase Mo-binding subunit
MNQMTELEYVGKKTYAFGARDVVTGKAHFLKDLSLPGMLVGKLLYSAHPSAKIIRLDIEKACALAGVVAVLTHQDIPGENSYAYGGNTDQPLLAVEQVYYQGDILAAIAAENEQAAQAALNAIDVAYQPLEGIYDPIAAMQPGSPQVWSHRPNIFDHAVIDDGDVENGFRQADLIIENTYHTQRVEQAFLEPEGAVAFTDLDGTLVVYASTQAPHRDRMQIARALAIPESRVRVIVPRIGGAFGGKDEAHVQIHAALLAHVTGKPVRLVRTRQESILTHVKRHPVQIRYKTGVTRDGRITAVHVIAYGDTGPYVNAGQEVMGFLASMAAGPYRIPNVRLEAYTIFTNNPICGAMRGFGVPQAAFAYERQMDEIARRLSLDPLKLRLINGLETGDRLPTGVILKEASAMKTGLSEAARLAGWEHRNTVDRQPASHLRRGWGIATTLFSIGLGKGWPDHAGASLEMTLDGSVILRTGATDSGQGTHAVLAQLAAESLGVDLASIRVITPDTDKTLNAGSSVATRQIVVSGNAVLRAAKPIHQSLMLTAAEVTDLPAEKLSLRRGILFCEDEPLHLRVADLAQTAASRDRPLHGEGFYAMEYPQGTEHVTQYAYTAYTFSTQLAKVLVDIQTGQVIVEQLVAVHEAGKMVNPDAVYSQIEGGCLMGVGYALMEELVTDKGRTLNPNLHQYLTPTVKDIHQIKVKILEIPESHLPYGAKGLGEPVLTPTAPAIANAIQDAIGVSLFRLPMTPERVLEAIDMAKGRQS